METIPASRDSNGVRTGGTIAAGILAAAGASTCCVGPLVLVTLGLGGAWVAGLRALEAFYPVFLGAAILFFGMAFWRLYLRPPGCEAGGACAPGTLRRQRIAFWATLVAAKALILFPFYAPLVLGDLATNTARVAYDDARADAPGIARAATDAGYPSTVRKP